MEFIRQLSPSLSIFKRRKRSAISHFPSLPPSLPSIPCSPHLRAYPALTPHPIAYLSRIPFYVEEAACLSPSIKALISYGGKKFTSISASTTPTTPTPQLLHIAGPETPRRESISVVPNLDHSCSSKSSAEREKSEKDSGAVTSFRYVSAKRDSGWVLPADEDYDGKAASLAHTRSLAFLKPLLHGPYFDLEAVWDEHCRFEFVERDVERTMATMVERPYVNHIPTMTYVYPYCSPPLPLRLYFLSFGVKLTSSCSGGIGKDRLTACTYFQDPI